MSPLYQRPHWLDYQWAIRYVVIKDAESHRKTHSKRWNQFPAVINLHSLILHNPVDSILILLHRTQTKDALTAKVTSVICLTVRSAKFNINQNAINSYKKPNQKIHNQKTSNLRENKPILVNYLSGFVVVLSFGYKYIKVTLTFWS